MSVSLFYTRLSDFGNQFPKQGHFIIGQIKSQSTQTLFQVKHTCISSMVSNISHVVFFVKWQYFYSNGLQL